MLINGDCIKELKRLQTAAVDLILTDPPYGMSYRSSWRNDKFDLIHNDNNIDWFKPFAEESYRLLKNNSHIYIFCNDFAISDFNKILREVGFNVKRTLVWVKNNHTSGDLKGDYGNKTEFILYAQKGRRLLNGKRDTNVLIFNRVPSNIHPTQKPIDLCSYLISKSTTEGETVLDPFLGSGTTAVAAKMLGRKFIGIELDKEYYDIAYKRVLCTTTPMQTLD